MSNYQIKHFGGREYMLFMNDDDPRGLDELAAIAADLNQQLATVVSSIATITSVDIPHVFSPESGFVYLGVTFRIKESRQVFEPRVNSSRGYHFLEEDES